MGEEISVRPLESLEDCRAASALFDRIWDERRVMGAPLLRALASHGGQVLGAFLGEEMVGAQVGLVGLVEGRPILHSHITGVAQEHQHRGVGFLLKRGQRDWCLERGIDSVTWTFDPMVARNARFNLHKLGATAEAFHRDYYGPMEDAFNRGDRSDRLEVRWDLRSPRVEAAMEGRPEEADVGEAAVLVEDEEGSPRILGAGESPRLVVRLPHDYHGMRSDDQTAARAWRDAVADALDDAFERGFRGVGFSRDPAYVLERRA